MLRRLQVGNCSRKWHLQCSRNSIAASCGRQSKQQKRATEARKQAILDAPALLTTDFSGYFFGSNSVLNPPPETSTYDFEVFVWGKASSHLPFGISPVPTEITWAGVTSKRTPLDVDPNDRLALGKEDCPFPEECIGRFMGASVLRVACGLSHVLVLTTHGIVFAYGMNDMGQAGIGEHYSYLRTLTEVHMDRCVADVACGNYSSVVMTADDQPEIYTWGRALCLGRAASDNADRPGLVDFKWSGDKVVTLASKANQVTVATRAPTGDRGGRLWFWGRTFFAKTSFEPACLFEFPNVQVKQISLGARFGSVLDTTGRVWFWGDGTYGEIARGNLDIFASEAREAADPKTHFSDFLKGFAKIEEMQSFKAEGHRVYSPGRLRTRLAGGARLPNVAQVACGARHCLMLGEDGSVWAVGDNQAGQCGTPSVSTLQVPREIRVHQGHFPGGFRVAAGYHHSAILDERRHVYIWGHNSDDKLISSSDMRVFLRTDGSGGTPPGVAVQSGIRDKVTSPQLVFRLLHRHVLEISLSTDFTVVAVGRPLGAHSEELLSQSHPIAPTPSSPTSEPPPAVFFEGSSSLASDGPDAISSGDPPELFYGLPSSNRVVNFVEETTPQGDDPTGVSSKSLDEGVVTVPFDPFDKRVP